MKTTYRIIIILFFPLAFLSQKSIAQDSDELFEAARAKAFNGQRREARELLAQVLDRSPDYHDARILLARTFAWDDRYDDARKELNIVIDRSPKNIDAYRALTDVEMWSDKYQNALHVCTKGLEVSPVDEDLLYKKASIEHKLTNDDDALSTLQQLLLVNPSHKRGLALVKDINTSRKRFNAGANAGVDFFSRTFDPAYYASVQVGRINRWGSLIGRVNYANRFNTNGVQVEADAYPRIVNGVYAYINYGYSSTNLFPQHRAGAEIFSKLPHALEGSAGLRYLYFDAATKVTLYTASLGWYFSDYWISARTFITPDNETGTSVSGSLTLRKYLSEAESYISISAGAGFSPDFRRIQSTAGLSADQIYTLRAQRIGLSFQKLLKSDVILLGGIDITHQELIFDTGNFVVITSITAGIRKKF